MNTFGKLFALFLVGALCTTVSADLITYGDYEVTTVTFLNVAEDGILVSTNPEVRQPLFGTPTGPDNSLLFNPVSFGAYSTGSNSNSVDGRLELEIEADPGYGLLGVEFRESGDYAFVGTGTSNTSVSANLSVFISVEEVNGLPITDPLNPAYGISFAQTMFSIDLSQGSLDGTWANQVFSNFYGILDPGDAITKVSVVLDNTLNASSEAGTESLIHKKMFLIKAYTGEASYVPEPSTIVLMGLGALSLLFFRRKTK